MPKGSVVAFRPTGLAIGRRFYSETDIDSIIEVAGGLPVGDIEHTRANESGDELFSTVLISRREALTETLHRAAEVWHYDRQWQTDPTPRQLTVAFEKVEKAAASLLEAVHLPLEIKSDEKESSLDILAKLARMSTEDMLGSMPTALRFDGLGAQAVLEAQAAVKAQAALGAARTAYVPGEGLDITGSDLLRNAVRGVYQLHVWSQAAKKVSSAGSPTPREDRNKGDPALDELFKSLQRIWNEVFNRPIKSGLAFVGKGKPRVGGPTVRFFAACLKPLPVEKLLTHEAINERIKPLSGDKGKSTPKKVNLPR